MRRALLRALPALAAVHGIRPWEIELLTEAEIRTFLSDLKGGDHDRNRP